MLSIRALTASLCLALAPLSLAASDATDKLLSALGMEQMIALMQEEGKSYAVELGEEMLPNGYTESWGKVVERIYNTEAMQIAVKRGFARGLDGVDITPLEEHAKDDAFILVDDFVKAGDLLEANVVGALNSNIQFYHGLVDGGAFELSEDQILSDVWGQEKETRMETRDWLYGFLIMAYAPLEPGVLEAYTELSRTEAGAALNAALFDGFDSMYNDISPKAKKSVTGAKSFRDGSSKAPSATIGTSITSDHH